MTSVTLGTIIYGFFIDHLAGQKGLRPPSIRSYRDAVRLFLSFVSADARRPKWLVGGGVSLEAARAPP